MPDGIRGFCCALRRLGVGGLFHEDFLRAAAILADIHTGEEFAGHHAAGKVIVTNVALGGS